MPEALAAILEDVPEELHQYIIEEIIQELENLEHSRVEMSKIDHSKSQKDKLLTAIKKKRLEVASENRETIKHNKQSILSKNQQKI